MHRFGLFMCSLLFGASVAWAQISMPDGAANCNSVGLPFAADPDTGFVRSAANSLGICTGGSLVGTWSRNGLSVVSNANNAYQLTQTVAGNQIMFKYVPADANAVDWNIVTSQTPNTFSARQNVTFGWGYNVQPGFAREDSHEPALYHSIETFYTPSNGVEWM